MESRQSFKGWQPNAQTYDKEQIWNQGKAVVFTAGFRDLYDKEQIWNQGKAMYPPTLNLNKYDKEQIWNQGKAERNNMPSIANMTKSRFGIKAKQKETTCPPLQI